MSQIKVKTSEGWQEIGSVPSSVPIEAWHEVGAGGQPPFQNGWVNFGSTYSTCGFRKTPDGRVWLKGLIQTGAHRTVVFTLPVGYRPSSEYLHMINASNDAGVVIRIDRATGTVTCDKSGASWVSLDGVSFETTQSTFPTGPAGPVGPAPVIERVLALPVGPADGKEVDFVADDANGVSWRLRYNAASASAYKWEFRGGPPVRVYVAASTGSIGVTGYAVMGGGPTMVLPLSGDYDVAFGAFCSPNMANYGFIAPAFLPAAASDDDAIQMWGDSGGEAHDYEREIRKTGLVAGNQVQLHMKVPAGTMACTKRVLRIRPVRVG